jgi:hypothetical protein
MGLKVVSTQVSCSEDLASASGEEHACLAFHGAELSRITAFKGAGGQGKYPEMNMYKIDCKSYGRDN